MRDCPCGTRPCNEADHWRPSAMDEMRRLSVRVMEIEHDLNDACRCEDCTIVEQITKAYRLAIVDAATDPTEQMIT